jgi:hypothetical protein
MNKGKTEMELIDRLRNSARNTTLPKSARDLLTEAADELQSPEAIFNLRWDADLRAIRRWRAAGTGRELKMPDHADLVVWLLEQLEPQVRGA